jgi:hypothetical protein
MNIVAKIIMGDSKSGLPMDAGEAIFYYRTNGDVFIRWQGVWKRIADRTISPVPSEKWQLLAGIPVIIRYADAFKYLPTVSWSCHAAGDPNNHVTPRFTALSKTSMTVVSDIDAWFAYTASPNMREATQTLEPSYTE